MKVLYRLIFLTVQLAILVPLGIYFGSKVNFTEQDISVLNRRFLDSEVARVLRKNHAGGGAGELEFYDQELFRMVTAFPPEKNDELYEKDVQVPPPPLIPYGPDETPPGSPAEIPTNFTVEEADFCTKRPDLEVIAYVHSSISEVKGRQETRMTWGNATAYNLGVNIGVVFMVGRPKNDAEKKILKEESEKYHDIVQGEYGDHYRLLSYKALASLYWINKHCSQVPWTLHSDDDIFIDIFLFMKEIRELSDDIKKMFICSHMYGPALRSGRWYVSYEQYPTKNYPLYCSGGAWFLQTQYIPRLLNASKVVPYLWVDDAYLSGLLATEAGIERYGFQKHYGRPRPHFTEVGQKVAWFYLKQPRLKWWAKVLEFHIKASKYSQR